MDIRTKKEILTILKLLKHDINLLYEMYVCEPLKGDGPFYTIRNNIYADLEVIKKITEGKDEKI